MHLQNHILQHNKKEMLRIGKAGSMSKLVRFIHTCVLLDTAEKVTYLVFLLSVG